jgi:hypothetical protein
VRVVEASLRCTLDNHSPIEGPDSKAVSLSPRVSESVLEAALNRAHVASRGPDWPPIPPFDGPSPPSFPPRSTSVRDSLS